MNIIGVDVGGTKINFVLLKGEKIVKSWKISTPKNKGELIKTLKNNIPKEVQRIGIGVPGPLNKKGDIVLILPHLKALNNCPLAKIIERETGIKTKMDNDANCFVLGEALLGAGKGVGIVFGITLGTGVGGGMVINGKIYRGAFGSAGEVGHMTIKFDGPRSACGNHGCLEEYCSGRFFLKNGATSKEFKNKAENGDPEAIKIYNEYGRYLGIGLANVINLFDPEVIIVGGGIANAYNFFIEETENEIKKRVISPIAKKYIKIKKAALGDLAGAIGAALL